jgi:asparagine synthase (glutamine-hydrolysing)
MSGICALVGSAGAGQPEPGVLESLLKTLARPGSGKGAVLRHGRVGVCAFDQFGGDPARFLFEDADVLVACDAEIHNHKELGEGARLFSEAALIARLWKEKGDDWWKPLRGTYSAFIWDKAKSVGSAYTDRIGVKPLVYAETPSGLLISSLVRCLKALPGFKRELDPQAVFSFMNMEIIPAPTTIFRGVMRLESGHRLRIGQGAPKVEMAWDLRFSTPKDDEKTVKERIYSDLQEAVRLQASYRDTIDEVGCFLSGGTDSSTIAGFIDQLFPGQSKTFSMGFDEEGFDEMQYSRLAAKAFHTHHTEYYVTAADILNSLPTLIREFDEPFGNSSAVPTYFCAKLAREHGIKTLLGGDGGDEIYGGNSRYYNTFQVPGGMKGALLGGLVAPVLSALPDSVKSGPLRQLSAAASRIRAPLHEKIHSYSLARYLGMQEVFSREFLDQGPFIEPAEVTRRYLDRVRDAADLDKFLYNDIKITLMDNDLHKVRNMTELAGINVRFPYLDPVLVEYSGHIPPELKVKGSRLRYVFKEAMRSLLPVEIIEKKKHGFGLPVVKWMMRPGKLNDLLRETLFDGRLEKRGIFRKGFAERMYALSGKDQTTFFGTYLYYLFVLELWLREHADA